MIHVKRWVLLILNPNHTSDLKTQLYILIGLINDIDDKYKIASNFWIY